MNNNKKNQTTEGFDFDYWMELAEKHPEEFERQRQQEIQDIIDSAPEYMKKRLNGLQWRIDAEIKRAKNPMDACIRVNRIMMEMLFGKNGFIEVLTSQQISYQPELDNSSVINFKTHQRPKQ